MKPSFVLSAVAALVTSCFAVPHHKRSNLTSAIFYAHGTGIDGLQLYWGDSDNRAYIAHVATTNYSSVSWNISGSSTTTDESTWTATELNENGANKGKFYIVDSGFSNAGFMTADNTSAVNGATTTGFRIVESELLYSPGNNGTFESKFYAEPVSGVDNTWALMWSADGTESSDSVSVTIKTE